MLVKEKPKQIKKKKMVNPDLVKACEIIMKKNTTQNEMKEMAKDFLKEKGVIKEEKEINKPRKKAIKTEVSQPESIINPERYCSRSIKKQE